MTKLKTDVTRAVALATLLGGIGACAESEGGGTAQPTDDPVEAAIADLGVPIVGCDGAGTPVNGSGFANNTLTLNVGTDPLVLSAGANTFSANGYKCTQTVSNAQKALKTTDLKKIVINGSAADNKVILDFLPGTFGTGILSATAMGSGILVDFTANSGAGNDSLMIRGGTSAESYKFAAAPAAGPTTDIYVDITGDKTADINVKPSATGTVTLTASMGGGNDVVNANTQTGEIDKFSGVATAAVEPLGITYGLTAYGGPGDDTFTGGLGDDAFYGGDGKDTFKAIDGASADGADVYSGDADEDTVNYEGRTGALAIDVGPVRAAIEGGADLRAPGLYGATGSLNGKSLTFVIDGVRIVAAFTTPAKPSDILSTINTAANTAFMTGQTPLVYATLNGKNHLVITSQNADPNVAFVKIESDPGIAVGAAMTDADSVLMLTVGAVTTLPAVGVDLTTAALYGGSSTLMGRRLVLIVNGVYVTTTFGTPADAAAVLTQINNAINTALGTTAVKYATQSTVNNKLEITATTLTVVAGIPVVTTSVAAAPLLGFTSKQEGTVDMSAAALYTALANQTLGVVIDGALVQAAMTATPTDAATVIAAINAAADTELGTTGVKYASLSTTKHLVISSATDVGGVTSVRFVGSPAIAMAGGGATGAETPLGLTPGPGAAKLIGADLSAAGLYGGGGTLALVRLVLVINGTYVTVAITAPANSAAVLTAINTAANTALGTSGVVYASENATTHKLELAATWVQVKAGAAAQAFTSASATLGFGYNAGLKHDSYDADDGYVGERDDVRYSTENITGGSGNDLLVGNDKKNTIKGNDGDDTISGGANGATCMAANGDVLTGGAGNDTFLLAAPNCRAGLTGGDGNNTADFSGRSADLVLKNNGTADDGEAAGAEAVNIATDIKKLVGGFGADQITGGASDETFVGGPGGDTIVGGTGNDTMDYSASPLPVLVTLCFTTTLTACPMADDGVAPSGVTEGDQIYQVEHLIGSPGDDTLSGATATLTELTIEGGAGIDLITGGAAGDTLWGDAGDDHLIGGGGADQLSGDAGDDWLEGGDSDQDICLGDAADVTHAKATCEL